MDRSVMWTPWEGPGLEHLYVRQSDGVSADGVVIGVEEGTPFRIRYTLICDVEWRVRELHVTSLAEGARTVHLITDGEGHWRTGSGQPFAELERCLDVDISATPFTNTLPIRRLALQLGESRDIAMAYVAIPSLEVTPERQRYTCLERRPDGGLFRFESLTSEFRADLQVDADGLVLDYSGLFRRVRR